MKEKAEEKKEEKIEEKSGEKKGEKTKDVLPAGWSKHGPDEAGEYWYEHEDGRSQWEKP